MGHTLYQYKQKTYNLTICTHITDARTQTLTHTLIKAHHDILWRAHTLTIADISVQYMPLKKDKCLHVYIKKCQLDRNWHAKTNTRFVLRWSRAFRQICFYFILTYFEDNPKWRLDDVIPETVDINRSASNAIPDISLRFDTSDTNLEKIL